MARAAQATHDLQVLLQSGPGSMRAGDAAATSGVSRSSDAAPSMQQAGAQAPSTLTADAAQAPRHAAVGATTPVSAPSAAVLTAVPCAAASHHLSATPAVQRRPAAAPATRGECSTHDPVSSGPLAPDVCQSVTAGHPAASIHAEGAAPAGTRRPEASQQVAEPAASQPAAAMAAASAAPAVAPVNTAQQHTRDAVTGAAPDAGDGPSAQGTGVDITSTRRRHAALSRVVSFLLGRMLVLEYAQRDEDRELLEAARQGAEWAEEAFEDADAAPGPSSADPTGRAAESGAEFDAAVGQLAETVAQLMARWHDAHGAGGDASVYTHLWKGVRRAHQQDLQASGIVASFHKRTSRWAADKGPQPLNKHAEIKARARVEMANIANGCFQQTGVDCFLLFYDEPYRKVHVMTAGRLAGLARAAQLEELVHHYVGLQRNMRAIKSLSDAALAQASFGDLHVSLQRKCAKKIANIFQPEGARQHEHPFKSGAFQRAELSCSAVVASSVPHESAHVQERHRLTGQRAYHTISGARCLWSRAPSSSTPGRVVCWRLALPGSQTCCNR